MTSPGSSKLRSWLRPCSADKINVWPSVFIASKCFSARAPSFRTVSEILKAVFFFFFALPQPVNLNSVSNTIRKTYFIWFHGKFYFTGVSTQTVHNPLICTRIAGFVLMWWVLQDSIKIKYVCLKTMNVPSLSRRLMLHSKLVLDNELTPSVPILRTEQCRHKWEMQMR